MYTPKKKINLHNLAEATAQEVFDHVAHHLLTQNAKSILEDECLYKSSRGILRGTEYYHCAAGCLIPDELYDTEFEGVVWHLLVIQQPEIFPLIHSSLISNLQFIHDAEDIKNWKTALKYLAFENNLEFKFD